MDSLRSPLITSQEQGQNQHPSTLDYSPYAQESSTSAQPDLMADHARMSSISGQYNGHADSPSHSRATASHAHVRPHEDHSAASMHSHDRSPSIYQDHSSAQRSWHDKPASGAPPPTIPDIARISRYNDVETTRTRRLSQPSPYQPILNNYSSPASSMKESATNAVYPKPMGIPPRTSNPMSVSSMLSNDTPTRPDQPQSAISVASSPPDTATERSRDRAWESARPRDRPQSMSMQSDSSNPRHSFDRSGLNGRSGHTLAIAPPSSTNGSHTPKTLPKQIQNGTRPSHPSTSSQTISSKPPDGPPGLTTRATEHAFAEIEARELSDVDMPEFDVARDEYMERVQKRALEFAVTEGMKRKRRRLAQAKSYLEMFNLSAEVAREIFVATREQEAETEVRSRDVEEEKERKKDQQRKRRRERTLEQEQLKRDEAMEKLLYIEDDEERAKVMRDLQRFGKKIKNTEDLLQGKTISRQKDAALSADELGDEATPEPTTKSKKHGKNYRPRKSKEQKLAEKESAAAGQAFLGRGDELPDVFQEDDTRPTRTRRETRTDKEVSHASKGYVQIYEQIWKDMAKNHVSKALRIRNTSLDVRQSNLRKTAQLAAKEAKRWQLRTNKNTKEIQARAKRSMREMLSFWKRNERDERDQRKIAERQELENARKAEADREAARQKRKLNFLISQTELYSHFIGKKVKTDELERSTDNVAISDQTIKPAPSGAHEIDMPDSNANLAAKVTNFEDLDFDAEDETALQQAAMANAQNAVKEAQDRARAFDNEGQLQSQFDDGEMNFQNPTSLQNMDVEQPKMLSCQLKEYQVKGLNWLVNLYEQGINGILADEMGLGKTVQSISVMAHLAEAHNIWGPFLVIAPASTLHNWQQEIAKFVPNIKVLPYWGNAKDRKVLRKFWDRKHITYNKDSSFHVLVTSYQLVVQDTVYFQKVKWQYMILDEAQAIKSSSSSRWKALLGFHCRNRLLLTGTPIQNNMQELWALLHFIMPSLFDSHDEFSEWFSKDVESHAQSNTKLNEDQLKRLHMILKPFMLRRVKKHVQKELGDKVEEDVFCSLTYRQRALYTNLRNKISLMDLIEKAAVGDDQDTATLMNLVMQFRKVCNHPDLFERAAITSPLALSSWAETASFMREGGFVQVPYSARNLIEYWLPALLYTEGRLDLPGPRNMRAGWRKKYLHQILSIWDTQAIAQSAKNNGAFAWLRFANTSPQAVSDMARSTLWGQAMQGAKHTEIAKTVDPENLSGESREYLPAHSMLNIVRTSTRRPMADISDDSRLGHLFNISRDRTQDAGYGVIETCASPRAQAPPIEVVCADPFAIQEAEQTFFNVDMRRKLYPLSPYTESALLSSHMDQSSWPNTDMLPEPASKRHRYTNIQVPSMRRVVTDSGKLAALDTLLKRLKEGGHRVLLYFQMTRMIDLMEEYLTYRNYKYCRLDGSTKLEDRRDTVAAFQGSDEIFVFLLSTRAGGLGINLTAADTVIFYDSDWNPTIDSQAMDRAHRLGQTRQVTVYRLITRGTIEERIRKRALQKEEVQRVVISGGAPSGQQTVDFNGRSKENRTKDIALWLADDDEAAAIEQKEAELAEMEAKDPQKGKKRKAAGPSKRKEMSMDDMYHEGEGKFDDESNKPSGTATPVVADAAAASKKKKGVSKKAKTVQQRLAVADGQA